MKAVLKAIAFIIIMFAITYLVFVVWLPSVRSSGIQVEGGGTASNPYIDINPEAIKQEDEWIVLKGSRESPWHADLLLDYPGTPKYIKMIWLIGGSGDNSIEFSTVPIERPEVKISENVTIQDLQGIEEPYFHTFNIKPGKYVIEVYIDEKGFIEKLIINGKEIPQDGTRKYFLLKSPPKDIWRLDIFFTDNKSNFIIKVKILEVKF